MLATQHARDRFVMLRVCEGCNDELPDEIIVSYCDHTVYVVEISARVRGKITELYMFGHCDVCIIPE